VRFATYLAGGCRRVGLLSADGSSIRTLALPPREAERGVLALIDRSARGEELVDFDGEKVAIENVHLDAPIPIPRRNIWCVGRNYHAHAKELQTSVFKDSGAVVESWPIIFTKVPECVVGPFDDVQLPSGVSSQVDYEAELLVVIGEGGKNISRVDAMRYVWGYSIVNDVTARDVQMRHQQWDMGKSFDTFCPMGPWIVTADEFDGRDARLRCWVNGELRQDAKTTDLIFDIPTLIETISRGITLYPGDLIATGTPAGVGMGMKPPQYLKPGDRVRVEVDGLGSIENGMVAGDTC
jgi:2-keto-4-pentenoate hydratase/2-oxohepta-3-ene-1,7-dioic acid hydratase in catechol pathway|tara:strand:- start:3795 stop:4679 length:885 start_codon:yes stop_codon:yes gene_type:complete